MVASPWSEAKMGSDPARVLELAGELLELGAGRAQLDDGPLGQLVRLDGGVLGQAVGADGERIGGLLQLLRELVDGGVQVRFGLGHGLSPHEPLSARAVPAET